MKGERQLSVSESSKGGVQGGLRWGRLGLRWERRVTGEVRGEVVCQRGKLKRNPLTEHLKELLKRSLQTRQLCVRESEWKSETACVCLF